MSWKCTSLLCGILLFLGFKASSQSLFWISEGGVVSFDSKAPLENIKAESHALRAIINPDNKSFAFTMNINSFDGFNSEMQQTHFLENYLEWKKYPEATFTGKLIEDVPFDIPGTYSIRAKGNLYIHGITKERIIRGSIIVKKGGGHVETHFTIPISDHGISIPKIVQQKISDEINVTVNLDFIEGQKS